ncbi:MAG: TRAP transporter small permease [Candidatus Accumulibacter sp.]|jgi:TRAP-type C4-dicarboxylate transport system permease small subunit|nr:TRAP transporter small permease [Accumulibacter sp.]
MKFPGKIRRGVDGLTNWLAIGMFLFIFAVVMAQIVFRYFLMSPLVWSEELSRAIFIWVSLMGWVLATRNGSHIRITFFANCLPAPLSRLLGVFMQLATIAFLIILGVYGSIMTWRTLGRSLITIPAIPVGVLYLSLPVTALLGVFYNLCDLATDVTQTPLRRLNEKGGAR